ncbi:MAG: hypothetical protein NT015_02935 [Alphaproteobacteria bacterium]|nr:hypothetical protein [Alphaproteobacteria bacterium]
MNVRVCVIMFALLATPAFAQTDDSSNDLVVRGVRPEQIQSFVEQVAVAPPSVDQIARWDDALCLSVAGLSVEQGQTVVDRVAMRAQAVGLSPGRTGCRPNVFVYFAADAGNFTRALVDERKSLFAYYHEENIATLGREALQSFIDAPSPVRWWHVIQTRGADGDRLGSDQAGSQAPPPPTDPGRPPEADGLTGVQAVRSNGSRLRAAERQDFNRVIVIVDGSRLDGYPLVSIADYIALVTLAQIDPTAETRDYPTILNLFADDPDLVSFEMTTWDLAYLNGLYRSARNAASVTQQMRDISRRMAGDAG